MQLYTYVASYILLAILYAQLQGFMIFCIKLYNVYNL